MIVLISLIVLALLWAAVAIFGHGYVNSVDTVAYWLHQHARRTREMHERRAAVVQKQWIQAIESRGE